MLRFRCIGGTSAGAIAAALTAAAEYRCQHGGGQAGFEELNRVQNYISKGTNLRDLFQPTHRDPTDYAARDGGAGSKGEKERISAERSNTEAGRSLFTATGSRVTR
jgi:hypothetical protein